MPFVQWIEESEATGDVAEAYARYFRMRPDRTKVADIMKCFSHRPDFCQQVMDFSWGLHFCDGHLTEPVKEMIATLVSGQNQCPYCMHSHAYFLQHHGTSGEAVSAIGRGEVETAPVTEAERELLRFAHKMTHQSWRITAEDAQALRNVGWTEPQIAEAIYTAALFAFFNRVANGFGLESPQYFEMRGEPNPLAGYLTQPKSGGQNATSSPSSG
jgi:uncharacterized peroxidase-related enzyme